MLAVDTNLVVRYLTRDHPEESERARDLLAGGPVFVPVTVVLETEWVLRSLYRYAPVDRVAALRGFLGLPAVSVGDPDAVAAALDLADSGMDLADALHLSLSDHCEGFATFERRLVRNAREAGHSGVRET